MKPSDLKFGMHVIKTVFYSMISADYIYYTNFLHLWAFEASGSCFIKVRVRAHSYNSDQKRSQPLWYKYIILFSWTWKKAMWQRTLKKITHFDFFFQIALNLGPTQLNFFWKKIQSVLRLYINIISDVDF